MAKSTGNVVNPFFALDRFDVDAMRYYLAHDGGIHHDADYDNALIIERYKKGLQDGLGNLTSRIVRGKGWSVRRAIESASADKLGADDEASSEQRARLSGLASAVDRKFQGLDPGAGLKLIMNTIYEVRSVWAFFQYTLTCSSSRTSISSCSLRGRRSRVRVHGNLQRSIQAPRSNAQSSFARRRFGSAASYCRRTCRRKRANCWTCWACIVRVVPLPMPWVVAALMEKVMGSVATEVWAPMRIMASVTSILDEAGTACCFLL